MKKTGVAIILKPEDAFVHIYFPASVICPSHSLLFIYLGLHWLFAAHGLSLLVACGLLVAMTSLVTEHRL